MNGKDVILFLKNERIQIFLLYLIFAAGGLWHVLGIFQLIMKWMAAPLLIFVSLLIFIGIYRMNPEKRRTFISWWILVFIFSIIVEAVGVETGLIFGQYQYGDVLYPKILGVPLAIGFAWTLILLSSLAVVRAMNIKDSHVMLFVIPLFMVLFDLFMEPAATVLDYWTWKGNSIPVLNYIAWYFISLVFVYGGTFLGLFRLKLPVFVKHVYWSQLIYFIIVRVG